MLYHCPRLAPGRPAKSQKPVQRTLRKNTPLLKLRHPEMTELLENRQIEHEPTDRDTNARATLCRRENAERKILDRKMRISGRNFDEGFERGWP